MNKSLKKSSDTQFLLCLHVLWVETRYLKKISYSINLFNKILSLLQNEINMPKERHIKNPILSKVRKKKQLISENLWILFSRVDIKQKKIVQL